MTKKQEIQIFEDKKVRTVWDSDSEQWYFCVSDVVEVLTDSKNPTDYIKKMKKRDPALAEGWGQIVTPLSVPTAGVTQGQQYASLTDIITKEWSGMTTKQYKQHKGLKKESLRDNMTNVELALNMLAEASTTEISKQKKPKGYHQ